MVSKRDLIPKKTQSKQPLLQQFAKEDPNLSFNILVAKTKSLLLKQEKRLKTIIKNSMNMTIEPAIRYLITSSKLQQESMEILLEENKECITSNKTCNLPSILNEFYHQLYPNIDTSFQKALQGICDSMTSAISDEFKNVSEPIEHLGDKRVTISEKIFLENDSDQDREISEEKSMQQLSDVPEFDLGDIDLSQLNINQMHKYLQMRHFVPNKSYKFPTSIQKLANGQIKRRYASMQHLEDERYRVIISA